MYKCRGSGIIFLRERERLFIYFLGKKFERKKVWFCLLLRNGWEGWWIGVKFEFEFRFKLKGVFFEVEFNVYGFLFVFIIYVYVELL